MIRQGILILILYLISCGIFFDRAEAAQYPVAAGKTVLLKEQDVRNELERLLASKVAGRGWETRITSISMPSGIRIPVGNTDIEISPPPRWDAWGTASMTVMVRVNGRLEKNFSIRVAVDARADMVVASRQITSGTVLAVEDMLIERHDLSAVNGRYVASIEDAKGRKLKGTVRQGAPFRAEQLEKVPVIKNGQMVTILAENQVLRITTVGRSRGSGSIGDIVMVQNAGSLREIPATVLDASTVSIGF